MATKTDRVEARLSTDERLRIRRAAELAGQSISSFMVAAAVEKAEQVITENMVTVVPADYFDRLVAEIDKTEPAPRLARAAKRVRQRARVR